MTITIDRVIITAREEDDRVGAQGLVHFHFSTGEGEDWAQVGPWCGSDREGAQAAAARWAAKHLPGVPTNI